MEPEAIVAGLNTNMISAMLLTRLALPGMLEAGRGCVVNVASGAAMLGMPFSLRSSTCSRGSTGCC